LPCGCGRLERKDLWSDLRGFHREKDRRPGLDGQEGLLFEHFLGLAYEVEAAGDADQVAGGEGRLGDPQGLFEVGGHLAHLAAQLGVFLGQILRVHAAGRVDPGKDDLVGSELELLEHAGDVLVFAAAEDDDHGIVGDVLADGLDQGPDAGGVVGAVDQDAGIVANQFHAAG